MFYRLIAFRINAAHVLVTYHMQDDIVIWYYQIVNVLSAFISWFCVWSLVVSKKIFEFSSLNDW